MTEAILSEVIWHFVLPPLNTTRYVITQRQDGPFADDIIGGKGHYYISTERLMNGRWLHVEGSTWSAHGTFKDAYTKMQMAIK
jgi:hypothetical protein